MIDLDTALAFTRSLWNEDVKPEKHPHDLARHEILIERIQPTVVVETGLHWGYGARWWTARVPYLLTVERDAQMIYDYRRDAHGFGPTPENAFVYEGDSVTRAPDLIAAARRLAKGGPILVVLDSDHGGPHVLREMLAYQDLVTPGSYMVVEDGIYHFMEHGPRHGGNWYDGDAVEAVEAFLQDHEGWKIDHELEDLFPVTLNPSGWLLRLP